MHTPPPDSDLYILEDVVHTEKWAHGRAEGRLEGEILAYRHALRVTLEVRFGSLPDVIADRIERQRDTAKLQVWQAQAAIVDSIGLLDI